MGQYLSRRLSFRSKDLFQFSLDGEVLHGGRSNGSEPLFWSVGRSTHGRVAERGLTAAKMRYPPNMAARLEKEYRVETRNDSLDRSTPGPSANHFIRFERRRAFGATHGSRPLG